MTTKLVHDFDEKLFLLSNDVDMCKHQVNEAIASMHTQTSLAVIRGGHWEWTSGTLKMGSLVPWNTQLLNTDPSMFRWQSDHATLRIQEGGLYEIAFAFFSPHKPTLHVIVNEHSVMSAIHSPSYVVHHATASQKAAAQDQADGSVESVTGCSLMDFLQLPPKSTLSINYFGKPGQAKGFLRLRKV